jgi:predicted dehydrogenase
MERRPDVVLWGSGMVAGVHAAACRSLEWRITGVASRSPERAAALAATVGARAMTDDEVLASQVADLAIVATPPARHADDVVRLLDAGYQVVVEAPIACTLADADRIVEAEARIGRAVLYSEHLAASPVVDVLLTRVGSLGTLTHLSARAVQAPPTWRSSLTPDWGGGALFDLGVHPIGLCLRTAAEADAGAPESVSAVLYDAGTDRERATLRIGFGSGLVANLIVAWQPGASPDWDLQASSTSGVLRADLYPRPTLEHNGDPVAIGVPVRSAESLLVDDYGYAPQLKRFWTSLRTGRRIPITSRFGRQVLDVVCAAHRSAGRNSVETPLPFDGPRDRTPLDLLTDTS